MQKLTIRQPDDFHIHLRDGAKLARTVSDAAAQFGRVMAMPNLANPIVDTMLAIDYQQQILQHVPDGSDFTPYMTIYLTDNTSEEVIKQAADHPHVIAAKLYPAGATTNSSNGVTDVEKIYPIFEAIQKHGLVLCLHGEVTTHDIDIFDREAEFIERTLIPIVREFPELKIVLEHITTKNAVDFVTSAPLNVAATITAHHLLYNRNHLLAGGIKPHYYCLPVLKRSEHQQALLVAATSGNSKFFLGTDSAPHSIAMKQSSCGCAGIYSAHAAIEFYATAFEQMQALDKLEDFSSRFGAEFYGLPLNEKTITLAKKTWKVPEQLSFGDEELQPLAAGRALTWQKIS